MKTSTTSATPTRDYTRKVYRHRPGSGPAKQWKKKERMERDGVWLVEFPLTCERNSKRGSQAREERMEIWDE
jgi:hypothetical protein